MKIIAGLTGCALRSFAFAIFFLEVCWGLLLAGLCLWIAGEESTIKGVLAACIAVLAVTICAIGISIYHAALSVVRKAATDAGLGRMIFDQLFQLTLNMKGEDPGKPNEDARVRTHLTREEVEAKLNDAARLLLDADSGDSTFSAPVFWLARQIQKISVWATVRIIVRACSHDGNSVNLFELRDRLASVIDQHLVSYLRTSFFRVSLLMIGLVSTLTLLVAQGIRLLPV